MARKSLPTSKRAAIWRAHERRCIYCTELVTFADLDVDHIVPDHLNDQPEGLAELLDDYGLGKDFDLDSLLNLVPSHRRCNQQKKGQILPKSRALHFLSIAEAKHEKAREIEAELKEQAVRDKFTVNLQVALEEGRISPEELSFLITRYTESRNIFEVLSALPFGDSELKGFISSTDIDSLYDRPILPRRDGLDKLTMKKIDKLTLKGEIIPAKERIEVRTCHEWVEAARDGYYPLSGYDTKEETIFKRVYAVIVALAQAKVPKNSFISDQKVTIANFDLLPVTLLPALSREGVEELQRFKSDGVGIPDLIAKGRVKIVSSSPLSLDLHYDDSMALYLNEILRADLNDDGVEDLLVGTYMRALGGSFGAGGTIALTRLGVDRPFTIAENIVLDVRHGMPSPTDDVRQFLDRMLKSKEE